MQFPKIKLLKFFVPKRKDLDNVSVANIVLGAQGKPKFATGAPAPYVAPFRMLCAHPIAVDITNSVTDKLPEITYSMGANGFAPPAEDIRLRLQDADGQIFRLMFPTANNTEFAYDVYHTVRNRWLALGGVESDLLPLYALIEIGALAEYYAVEIYEDSTQTLPTWRGLCEVTNNFQVDPTGNIELSANYFPLAWAQQVRCKMWYDPAFDGSAEPEHAKPYVQSVFTDFEIFDRDDWANIYKLYEVTGYEKVFDLHKLTRDEGTIYRSGVIFATVELNLAQSLIFDAMRNESAYDIWIYKNGHPHKPIIHSITVMGEGDTAVEYDTTGRVLRTEYRKKYRLLFSFRYFANSSACYPFNLQPSPAFDEEIEVRHGGAKLVVNESLGLYHNSDGVRFFLFLMPHTDDVVRYCVEQLRGHTPCPSFISGFDFSLPDADLGVVLREFPIFTNYCSQVPVYDILMNLAKFTGGRFFFEEELIRDYRQVLYFVNRSSNATAHLIHRDYIVNTGINLTLQQDIDAVANLSCDFGQDGELSENKNDAYDINTEKGAMNSFYKTLFGKTKKTVKFTIPNDGTCRNIRLYDKVFILESVQKPLGIDGYSIIGRKTKRNRDGGLTVIKKTIIPSENGAQYGTIEITAERWA